jgi:hypothetical protein
LPTRKCTYGSLNFSKPNRASRSTVVGKQFPIHQLHHSYSKSLWVRVFRCPPQVPCTSKLCWELLTPSSSKFSFLFIIGFQRFFELPSVGVCVSMWICFLMLVDLGTLCVSNWSQWSCGNGNPTVLWQWWSSISSFDPLLKFN